MTDLVAEEKTREAALAAHEATLSELRTEVATAQVQHRKGAPGLCCDLKQQRCSSGRDPHHDGRMASGAGLVADVPFGCGCMQAQLKEAQGATAAEAAKLAELQQRLDGVEAERVAAQDALAASRQEAAAAQEQLAEARKQVRCCSGQDGH